MKKLTNIWIILFLLSACTVPEKDAVNNSRVLEKSSVEIEQLILEKEKDAFKQKLLQFVDSEFFSYVDAQEVNEFKTRLHELFEEQKLSNLSLESKDLFEAKSDRLFEDEIFSVINVDEVEIAKAKVEGLLNIALGQWLFWYDFIIEIRYLRVVLFISSIK